MARMSEGYEGPICPSCNIRQISLVSISDNGNGPKVCVKCKRAMKDNKEITRFDRSSVNIEEIEKILAKQKEEILGVAQ